MSKVHITLVGGQPVPVYIGLADDASSDTVVLVCSQQSQAEADRLTEQFSTRNVRKEVCSPINLEEIENLTIRLKQEFEGKEICINLTSGTKLWSLSFFRTFSVDDKTDFIYVDQNDIITHILTKRAYPYNISTEKRIELYGSPLKSYRSIKEYTKKDFDVLQKIEQLRRFSRTEFAELTTSITEDDIEDHQINLSTKNESSVKYIENQNWAYVSLKKKGINRWLSMELECEHLYDILFNTGWFELKVAKEIAQIPEIQSVWLNCKFNYSEGNPKNEIDVISCYKNRLIFVECKTMIYDTTDIDKFRSALRNFSGISSKGIFVTCDKPSFDRLEQYKHAIEKCKDNGILTFNFAYFRDNPVKNQNLQQIIQSNIAIQNIR